MLEAGTYGRGRPLNRRLSACTGLVNTPALLNFSTTYAAWTPSDGIPSDGAAVISSFMSCTGIPVHSADEVRISRGLAAKDML